MTMAAASRSASITVRTADDDAQRVTVTLPAPSPSDLSEALAADHDLEELAALIARESGLPMERVLHLPVRVLHFARCHFGLEG
jgi:hypothetical protein